ncbi:MAG TPA: methenyltetrahydromethanopterin cyclohydrolase, partial [Burkholderiales bacterium]|nr:methenyltetrahydromethanopterin cyclohydrolase [Burkholderiales bacterium]
MSETETHSPVLTGDQPGINLLTEPLVEALVRDRLQLRIGATTLPGGARVVDAGMEYPGGIEAGRRIAEICLGGLGTVQLGAED